MSYYWNYSDPYEYMSRVAKSDMPPVIISVAITGGGGSKKQNPNLPVTPEEQAEQTYEAYKAGASAVHVHARDVDGKTPVYDPRRFREINSKIRQLCPDIIVGNSTGVVPEAGLSEALVILDAEPELCSLNMGSFAVRAGGGEKGYREWIFPFTSSFIEAVARKALERDIKPELEIYNAAMFNDMQNLIRQDLLKKPYWTQLVFAPHSSGICSPSSVLSLVQGLPQDTIFSLIGVGAFELPLTTLAIILGGHVRVGLEDNNYYKKGVLVENNAQLVRRTARLVRELGRGIATPQQAREMIGLSSTPRCWD
jgi:3-keto-5-aminohexanoate cleavage enzyme